MNKRLKGGYHLTKNDEVCIAVLGEGNKCKFVTGLEYHYAKWEDGKEALKLSLAEANDVVMGLCLNGYTAFIADMFYYAKVINPPKETENDNESK